MLPWLFSCVAEPGGQVRVTDYEGEHGWSEGGCNGSLEQTSCNDDEGEQHAHDAGVPRDVRGVKEGVSEGRDKGKRLYLLSSSMT